MQPKFETNTAFHIYNRGNNHENIFMEEKNYIYFLNLLEKYIIPIADIYAYCLMPNHFHLVLKIKLPDELPEKFRAGKLEIHHGFANMFNAYSKAINKAYQRRGSLFQKELKRKVITDDNHLQTVICYTHLNPVHHKFTGSPAEYEHSSYNAIVNNEKSIVKREETIDFFDDLDNFIYNHQNLLGLEDLEGLDYNDQ